MLSSESMVDATVYESYDGGDPDNQQHARTSVAWHRRIPSGMWLWLIVVGAIGALWAIAGSFRRILS